MPEQMTSRERVLTALKREIPDRVPWVENYVHTGLINQILGRTIRPIPGTRLGTEIQEKLCLDNISYDFRPPIYADTEKSGDLEQIKRPRLKTWEDLEKLKKWLPDPLDDGFYANAEELLKQKGDFAALASLRLGVSNVYNSMGYEEFVFALYDRPEFVTAAFEVFGDWCARVIERVNEMDFDFAWTSEDIAFQNGPMVTLEQYEKYIFPHMKKMAKKIRFPFVYHSDGDYNALLPYILQYNPAGIANLEPPVMDIFKLKETVGSRVCLVGNIDLHYTLTRGSAEETRAEVREKLERVGKGGGYMIASANGLVSYCIPENVRVMNETILAYGPYR
ncbi:MAG: uroporphyrinogen decarboxylase family protein [Thermodesulfobacteriota bacterium]